MIIICTYAMHSNVQITQNKLPWRWHVNGNMEGMEQSAINSHCFVHPAFIPSSPENSSIHRIFPTISVTLSAFWANMTCHWLRYVTLQSSDYTSPKSSLFYTTFFTFLDWHCQPRTMLTVVTIIIIIIQSLT